MEIGRLLKTAGIKLAKNQPLVFTGLAAGGLILTVGTAINATPKALILLEEEENDLGRDLSTLEVIKTTWKVYLPTAGAVIFTVFCIARINKVYITRTTALASAYGLSEKAFKEYKRQVVKTLGDKKEGEIREEIVKHEIKESPVVSKEVFVTGKGDTLCRDSLSGRYFRSDIETIRRAVNNVNHELISTSYVPLNDLYYHIGLPETDLGEMLGWSSDELLEVIFTSALTLNGEPCVVLKYDTIPGFV